MSESLTDGRKVPANGSPVGTVTPPRADTGRRRRLPFRESSAPPVAASKQDPVEKVDPGDLTIVRVYRRGRYLSSQLSLLVARYVSLRGELRALVRTEDLTEESRKYTHAAQCGYYLSTAKVQLESRRTNLAVCSNALGLAERQLVQLYSSGTLDVRFERVRQLLLERAPKSPRAERELELLDKYRPSEDEPTRMRIQEGLSTAYQVDERELLEDDLQVTRLRRLFVYMVVSWTVLMFVMPYVTVGVLANRRIANWPVFIFAGNDWLTQVVAALGISVMGAVGGVISGMFGVRDARATLGDFRTSLLRLSLKPVAGAIAALVIYLFLSWQVISGVTVTNGGAYVLAAFLAGFSERYFLRILRTEEQAVPSNSQVVTTRRTVRTSASTRRRTPSEDNQVEVTQSQSRTIATPHTAESPES